MVWGLNYFMGSLHGIARPRLVNLIQKGAIHLSSNIDYHIQSSRQIIGAQQFDAEIRVSTIVYYLEKIRCRSLIFLILMACWCRGFNDGLENSMNSNFLRSKPQPTHLQKCYHKRKKKGGHKLSPKLRKFEGSYRS